MGCKPTRTGHSQNLVRLATKPSKDKQVAFPGTKLKGKEAQTEVFLSATQYEHGLYRPLFYDVNILGFTKSS